MKNILNIEDYNQIIRSRRSIYPSQYTGEIIEKKNIEILLENANWAPTHKLTQPWFFKVFYEKSKNNLLDKMIEIIKNTLPPSAADKKEKKFEMFKKKVSHIIAIIMHRDMKFDLPEIEEVAAVACAVHNIHLSTTSLSIGGYWGTGGGTYSQTMHNYLKLNPNEKCLGFFYLGKINENHHPKTPVRKSIKTRIQWIKEFP